MRWEFDDYYTETVSTKLDRRVTPTDEPESSFGSLCDQKIMIEFTEEELYRIMKFMDQCGCETVQETVLHAIELAEERENEHNEND